MIHFKTVAGESASLSYKEFHGQSVVFDFTSWRYWNVNVMMLVMSGHARISVNYKNYALSCNSVVMLSSHLYEMVEVSDDFVCFCLFNSREFMEKYDPAEIIPIRMKYSVRLFRNPILTLSEEEMTHLLLRKESLVSALQNTGHYYYKEMVLNALIAFYLDYSDYFERRFSQQNETEPLSRQEMITRNFIELLMKYYRKEHNVEYYASKLHLSAHYLTLIVKKVTGRTPSDFIYEMLYGEAKSLLSQSNLSIQEVASQLNFSDQSSFGKFFKRKSGCSPFSYRQNVSDFR